MELTVPGDKSMTQRALILSSLAEGESRLSGLLAGADPRATSGALRALGAEIPALPGDGSEIRVGGAGLRGLRSPVAPLDLANSGTGARLLLGVLAGLPLEAVVTGDASLRSRPMARVTEPLGSMGAGFEALGEEGRLPLRVRGGGLRPLEYETEVASAQVKSALLLAGITGGVFVLLSEPGRSRDHTERMLGMVGAPVVSHSRGPHWRVELRDPPAALRPLDFRVPGDFSSAAFFLALGLLGGVGEELVIRNVGLNPTRTGLLPVLERMGSRIDAPEPPSEASGEPSGDLVVRPSDLEGVEVGGGEVPTLIDELPLVAVLGARARGQTRIRDAGELRVKETDRIHALVENLRAVGVETEEHDDGLTVQGTRKPLRGTARSFGDHRIAMAFGVLGALPDCEITVRDPGAVEVSYPGFWRELKRLTGGTRAREGNADAGDAPAGDRERGPVVTIDGPAGSGKSTTAREVARRRGVRHLDSGALYRALTYGLLERGVPAERWSELEREELERIPLRISPAESGFRVFYEDRLLEGELRSEEVTDHVSRAAKLPAVRARLLDLQRKAGSLGGLVADGRDMGTVVFPDADLKVFLTADLEERARRRLRDRGVAEPDPERVSREMVRIRERDRRDAGRSHAPLRRPEDALVIDTTALTFEAQVERIIDRLRTLTEG